MDDSMYQSKLFQTHSTAVITTVDAAVELLKTDSMDTLITVLHGLGAKHEPMNLEKAHYDLVGQALLDTLAKAVGDSFTEEVKQAWAGVYEVITANMMEGAQKARAKKKAKPQERMEQAMADLKQLTVNKVQAALLKCETDALADQDRIQAEVAKEMERVRQFKASQAQQSAVPAK